MQAEELKQTVIRTEYEMVLKGFPLTKPADEDKIYEERYDMCLRQNGLIK